MLAPRTTPAVRAIGTREEDDIGETVEDVHKKIAQHCA